MQTSLEPWKTSFEQRLKKLTESKNHSKKIVYIYEKPDPSSFRYRVYNICQALDLSKQWIGTYFFENEISHIDTIIPSVDVFVFCRVRWSFEVELLFKKIKAKKKTTVFDIDDLVFDIKKVPLFLNSLGLPDTDMHYNNWFAFFSRYWMMGNMCDFTSSTNQFLCDQLTRVFQKPSYEISNFLNSEQIRVSADLYHKKNTQSFSNFRLGYFSGTPSHKNDFKKIAPEIHQFLLDYPQATLEVVGYMEFPTLLKKLVDRKQIFHSPLVDYLTLQKKKANVHINLAPLVENEFTNCKSELKFFEAAIVGTITCATPTFTFKKNIQHKETGFLCQEGDWYEAFKNIYLQKISSQMIPQARNYCLHKYSPGSQCAHIENCFNEILQLTQKS